MKVRGLPYSARESDIVRFFNGYGVRPEDVVFERSYGKMTGKSLVFMMNDDYAIKSVQNLHKKYLGNRYLELELC